MKEKVRSVVLAVLLVGAAVAGSVAISPAAAQTDTYSQQFTGSVEQVRIDLTNVSTEVQIEVITDGSPAGDNTAILRKNVTGEPYAFFTNAGAYENFTVKVTGTSSSNVSAEKVSALEMNGYIPGSTDGVHLGTTGGDPGFTYGIGEQIAAATVPEIPQLDATGLPGSTTVDTTGLDADQVETDLYQSAQNSYASTENYHTSLENHLSDAKTQARIVGKNAYIKALNNGSSKAAAKTAAKDAVADYYAVRQTNLVNEWKIQMAQADYMKSVAESETNVSANFATSMNETVYYDNGVDVTPNQVVLYSSNETLTLANGSSISSPRMQVESWIHKGDGGTNYENFDTKTVGVTDGPMTNWFSSTGSAGGTVYGMTVSPPNSNYEPTEYMDFQRFASQWSDIQSQNTQVQNDMDTLANNTYNAYQQGEINGSDLIDPYVLASERSPGENFETWSMAQLTLLGQNAPENFDSAGKFEVTTESGGNYTGILTSPENPDSGQFETNTTYNPDNINGTQYLVTSDQIVALDGNFTLGNITTSGGEQVQNVTIQKVQYETTNVTELKQLYDDLAYRRAQIEAAEAALAGGGGGFLSGSGTTPVAIAALAGAALLLLKD